MGNSLPLDQLAIYETRCIDKIIIFNGGLFTGYLSISVWSHLNSLPPGWGNTALLPWLHSEWPSQIQVLCPWEHHPGSHFGGTSRWHWRWDTFLFDIVITPSTVTTSMTIWLSLWLYSSLSTFMSYIVHGYFHDYAYYHCHMVPSLFGSIPYYMLLCYDHDV